MGAKWAEEPPRWRDGGGMQMRDADVGCRCGEGDADAGCG